MTILKHIETAVLLALLGVGGTPALAWIPHDLTRSIETELVSFQRQSMLDANVFDQAENLIHAVATDQASGRQTCLPDGSSIGLFTRQAFDQGREAEVRDYGNFVDELARISSSSDSDDDKVEKSMIAAINFARAMGARGHDIRSTDLIVHRETGLTFLLSVSATMSSTTRAQLEGQLAVVREMKRRMCR